jgi:hypothetical protein
MCIVVQDRTIIVAVREAGTAANNGLNVSIEYWWNDTGKNYFF